MKLQLPALTPYPIYNPDAANIYTGPLNFLPANLPRNKVDNQAVYLFDAMKLSEHWEINGGLRWENNKARTQTTTAAVTATAAAGATGSRPRLGRGRTRLSAGAPGAGPPSPPA